MQDEMPDERMTSSVYGEERLPSYTMWTSFAPGARPPAYSSGLSVPGTSWMVRRPFDDGAPRGNQYFHASKEWAPSTRSTSLKASLGTMVCSSRPLSVRLVRIP